MAPNPKIGGLNEVFNVKKNRALTYLAVLGVATTLFGGPALAGGTDIRICNPMTSHDLYISKAVNSGDKWWKGSIWYKARARFCTGTGVTSDNLTLAFAFAILNDAGELVPVTADTDRSNIGAVERTISSLCASTDTGAYYGTSSVQDRECGEDALSVPTSLIVVTGETRYDEFNHEIFNVVESSITVLSR